LDDTGADFWAKAGAAMAVTRASAVRKVFMSCLRGRL
jgi:hypothetical protein